MADPRIEVVGQLSEDEVHAVAALVEAATEVDGVRPLSEHVMLHLRYGGDAPTLASAMATSSFNLGTAIGTWITGPLGHNPEKSARASIGTIARWVAAKGGMNFR